MSPTEEQARRERIAALLAVLRGRLGLLGWKLLYDALRENVRRPP